MFEAVTSTRESDPIGFGIKQREFTHPFPHLPAVLQEVRGDITAPHTVLIYG